MKLTSHEFRLLSYLIHHKGEVVSRTELIEHLYDQDFDKDSNTHRSVYRPPQKKALSGDC